MTDKLADPTYDPIAAFAGQLAALGVRDVVISPGSRSTPLAATFHAHPDLRTHIQLDERSAGFFALGQAKGSGRPSVLICTSGTAAANYLPAVVEANHAGVPMIVCTADRPPELRDWGAGQTIDQVNLYGTNVRWFADFPVPGEWNETQAAVAAQRAFATATGLRRGPVHCNWPLRKPLEPLGAVPVREIPSSTPFARREMAWGPTDLAELRSAEKGLIIVGPDTAAGVDDEIEVAEAVVELSQAMAWPIVAEPLTQLRMTDQTLACAHHLFANADVVDALVPDVVVRFGGAPTNQKINEWLARVEPSEVIMVDGEQRWADASFRLTRHVESDPLTFLRVVASKPERKTSPWWERWHELDGLAAAAIDEALAQSSRFSGTVTRQLIESFPDRGAVVVSNSMPVRDVDAFTPANAPIAFVGNRGASGIDGITSTAAGLASQTELPVAVFIGDLALLHDLSGLVGVKRSGQRLTVVCVDNDGGQIFSMLPIHERLTADTYDTLFRTRHGIDIGELHGVGDISVTEVAVKDELAPALQAALAKRDPGVGIVLVSLEPEHDMRCRAKVHDAVTNALTQ